jgi:hypothetical protein
MIIGKYMRKRVDRCCVRVRGPEPRGAVGRKVEAAEPIGRCRRCPANELDENREAEEGGVV